MSSSSSRLDLEKSKNMIEVAGKLIIGLSALCYVLGLVVINIYLSKYSVYSLSLFRLNYITAGMLALSPVLFGLITFLIALGLVYPLVLILRRKWHSFFDPEEELPTGVGEHSFGLLLILLLAVSTGLTYATFRVAGVPTGEMWGILLVTALVTNVLCTLATCFGILLEPGSYFRQVILVIVPAAAALGIILHTVLFASYVYEKVPPHLGGGEPKSVELFVSSSEGRALLEEAEIEFEDDKHLATNVRLLFSTDGEYIILVKTPLDGREHAVTVRRELIQGIRPKDTFMLGSN
jgi:hypothetical protein